jgi:6-phosphogluconolactonase
MPVPEPTVIICRDADALSHRAAEEFARAAADAIAARGSFRVALAGGATPEATYRLLGRPPLCERIAWERVLVFFGDERLVPLDDPHSNHEMARRALLGAVPLPADRIFPVPTGLATAAEAADAYARTLVHEAGDPEGTPRLDLILLGLGEDGHTASLFPHAPALSVADRWATATPPGALPPPVERVTLTFPALNAARRILFLVSGERKADVLRDVLEGEASEDACPAAGVRPHDGTLIWLVDAAAASRLTRRA